MATLSLVDPALPAQRTARLHDRLANMAGVAAVGRRTGYKDYQMLSLNQHICGQPPRPGQVRVNEHVNVKIW
jgi:hypothetical protein